MNFYPNTEYLLLGMGLIGLIIYSLSFFRIFFLEKLEYLINIVFLNVIPVLTAHFYFSKVSIGCSCSSTRYDLNIILLITIFFSITLLKFLQFSFRVYFKKAFPILRLSYVSSHRIKKTRVLHGILEINNPLFS